MRIVVMENTEQNLKSIKNCLHLLLPSGIVKGFTDGNEAKNWCEMHSDEVDLFIGNWWSMQEESNGPEGANIASIVKWKRKPKVILCGDDEMFRCWSKKDSADGFILRPITAEKLRDVLEEVDI